MTLTVSTRGGTDTDAYVMIMLALARTDEGEMIIAVAARRRSSHSRSDRVRADHKFTFHVFIDICTHKLILT